MVSSRRHWGWFPVNFFLWKGGGGGKAQAEREGLGKHQAKKL